MPHLTDAQLWVIIFLEVLIILYSALFITENLRGDQ